MSDPVTWQTADAHACGEVIITIASVAAAIRKDVERFRARGDSARDVRVAGERADAFESAARELTARRGG